MTTPFDKEKRKGLTPQQYARFFASRRGICADCGVRIRAGSKWERDHIISLENGGPDTDENCQLLCKPCHDKKYPHDRAEAATSRRKYTNTFVPSKHRKKGFGFTKKFNGDVEIYD